MLVWFRAVNAVIAKNLYGEMVNPVVGVETAWSAHPEGLYFVKTFSGEILQLVK